MKKIVALAALSITVIVLLQSIFPLIVTYNTGAKQAPSSYIVDSTQKAASLVQQPAASSALPLLPSPSSQAIGVVKPVPENLDIVSLKPDEKETYTLTLITGDLIVLFKRPDTNDTKVALLTNKYKKGYTVFTTSKGELLVVPRGVDITRFSPEIFNIELLKEYQVEIGIKEFPLIVQLKKPLVAATEPEQLKELLPETTSVSVHKLKIINSLVLRVPFNKLPQVFEELATSPLVEKVMLDLIVKPQVELDSHLEQPIEAELFRSVPYIGAPDLWGLGYNGSGVKIAILDTGIDPSHPDFFVDTQSKIIASKSFVDYNFDGIPDEPVNDGHGHGTHVAGIAAGTGGYLPFVKGVAPGAQLIVGKVLSDQGWGYYSWIISGIDWAVQQGADIISMSLGGTPWQFYDPLVAAVNNAYQQGVLVVVAAGNEGPDEFTVGTPGVAEGALTVGAHYIEMDDIIWFSSRGPTPNGTLKPDVTAPGVYITAARANATYMGLPASYYHVIASGTSMATPHVSGFAAVLLEMLNKTGILQQAQTMLGAKKSEILKSLIVSTATDRWGYPWTYGAGIINATTVFNLYNNQSLIIIYPARGELALDRNETTIFFYNPWNKSFTLNITPALIPGVYCTGPPLPGAVTVPQSVTIPPLGVANITVKVNITALNCITPAYALYLFFTDNTTGMLLGKALYGINTWRPLNYQPQVYVTLQITYNGIPVYAEAFTETYLDLPSLTTWYHPVYSAGNGTLVIGPLFSNSAYHIPVTVYIPNPSIYGINADAVWATLFLGVATPPTSSNMVVNIDLATYPSTNLLLQSNMVSSLFLYTRNMLRIGTYDLLRVDTLFNGAFTGPSTVHVILANTTVSPPTTLLGPTVSAYFLDTGIDSKMQPVGVPIDPLTPIFYASYPVYSVQRWYPELPPTTVDLSFQYTNQTVQHVHSVITRFPVTSISYSLYGSINTYYVSSPPIMGYTGTVTQHYVDLNDPFWGGFGIEWAIVPEPGGSILYVYAEDWMGTWMPDGSLVLAPLRAPRGATTWLALYAYPGLDPYNYTGGFVDAHMLRTTLTGYFYLYPYTPYPLTTLTAIFNNEYFATSYSWEPLLWIDNTFYNHGAVPGNKPLMKTILDLDLSTFSNILSFYYKKAQMNVTVFINATYNALPFASYSYIGYWYGQGVRDVLPLAGYDYLYNMIPPGQTAIFAVIFNEPTWGVLDNTTVELYLVAEDGSLIPIPILGWSTYLWLPMAYVAIDASTLAPGSYGLLARGTYNNTVIPGTASFEILIDPLIRVALPAGFTPDVVFDIRVTDPEGRQIVDITSGSTLEINIDYDLSDFLNYTNAYIKIELFRDTAPVATLTAPLTQTAGTYRATMMVPWVEGTYTLVVRIVVVGVGEIISTIGTSTLPT